MKRASREEIMRELGDRWGDHGKRHLYLVLGSAAALTQFEKDLAFAKNADREPLQAPLSVNQELMKRLPDAELDNLVQGEAKYPSAVSHRLTDAFKSVVSGALISHSIVVLKDFELIFAFDIDLAELRLQAANGKHIVLLIPGHFSGDRIVLFHEADDRFQRGLPTNLVMDSHIWEIGHAE